MRADSRRDRAPARGAVAAFAAFAAFAASVLAVALIACVRTPPPEASVWSSEAPPTIGSPTAGSTLVATIDPGAIELHFLDPKYVPNALRSANGQVLWAAGETWPSELWRFVPGTAEPERLYASPRADGNITDVVAAGAGYAFVELSEMAFGKGGWRIWFLSGPGEEPIELDRGRAPGAGVAPTIAMDDEHIAWAAFDEPASGPISRIRVVSADQLEAVTTLAERPFRDGLFWFPALDRDALWYGVIVGDFDFTGVGDEFHLETLDLAHPAAPAVRFKGVANDFNPSVNQRFVVWKTNVPGDAALNWGTLHVQDRPTQTVTTIPVDRANRPSLGDRFVAFEEITHTRLALYDLVTGSVLDVVPGGTTGAARYGGHSVSGRLLAFFTQEGGGPPRIGWAVLPE